MISRDDLQRILRHDPAGKPIVSLFLDMSVNSDNKRTYPVFLSQKRSEYAEASGARNGHLAEELNELLDRLALWIESEFEESNQGLAVFAELGGDWFEWLQFPARVENRLKIGEHVAVAPLIRIIGRFHHHGVILVDREHMRMLSVYMGRPLREHEVDTQPYPVPHDVRAGGYSALDYQKRKAEEVKHFFREFAKEVEQFVRRYNPDDLIVLGTDENVKHFLDFLPDAVRAKVVETGHAPVDAPTASIIERLTPLFRRREAEQQAQAVDLLRDRVHNHHYATAGFSDTLEQLQEGKVETLVVVQNLERDGARCIRCGFYIAAASSGCPYCGGDIRDGVDLVETMIRLAAAQDATVEFAEPASLQDMEGVGALLRF